MVDPVAFIRSDVVGSLLRPANLLAARAGRAAGRMDPVRFSEIEDQAVDHAIALQEDAGLPIVSDGEMRRLSFQSQMVEAVEGFGEWDIDAFLWGHWHGDPDIGDERKPRPPTLGVVGKLKRARPLATGEFVYLRDRTTRIAKITLPSPSLFANFWSRDRSSHAYPTLESFLADVTDILRTEVGELVALGARYIQIDAPHYPLLFDDRYRAFYEALGWSATRWLEFGVELDNAVMDAGRGAVFGFHLCRGNQASRWLVEGGYEKIAARLFGGISADRLLLEYDDWRSGSFAPLLAVPDDKIVVLGLITTKRPAMEDRAAIIGRIREGARFVPIERLAISPQCGFASSVVGNALTEDDERGKLRLVAGIAQEVWG
jgi:5-methyltetrahydropteroyltriglutamate--homocysteine methyltransferase